MKKLSTVILAIYLFAIIPFGMFMPAAAAATSYSAEFTSLCEGQEWFIDEIERQLNIQEKTIDTIKNAKDFEHIVALELTGRGIAGKIPAAVGQLKNLKYLHLSQNNLYGTIPDALYSLENLIDVDLSQNSLAGDLSGGWGDLPKLKNLHLWGNQLTGQIPADIAKAKALVRLDLAQNKLTGEIPAQLATLPQLELLSLSNNTLAGEIPAQLGELPRLKALMLWDNQLEGEIPAELGGIGGLKLLDISKNRLTGGIPAELGGLTNLVGLALNQNSLTGEIPAELGQLENLEKLDLYKNQLTGEIPAELAGMVKINTVDLSWNGLTGSIPAELSAWVEADKLFLNKNGFSGKLPDIFSDMEALTELDLSNNKLVGDLPEILKTKQDAGVAINVDFNYLAGPVVQTMKRITDNFANTEDEHQNIMMFPEVSEEGLYSFVGTINLYEEFRTVDNITGQFTDKEKLPPSEYRYSILSGDTRSLDIVEDETGVYVTIIGEIDGDAPVVLEYQIKENDRHENSTATMKIYSGEPILRTIQVAAGSGYTLMLKEDGTVWEAGNRESDFWPIYKTKPEQVEELSNIVKISVGGGQNLALANDGTVWAWGTNIAAEFDTYGEDYVFETPYQIESATDVVDIVANYRFGLALKQDGTVSSLLLDFDGESGPPFELEGVKSLSSSYTHVIALKHDGTVWARGANGYGQLGDGTTDYSFDEFVQMQGITNVEEIYAGYNYSLILKEDGTVWGCGGFNGEFVDDTNISYTLKQVKGLTDITEISLGRNHGLAVKDDGTVLAWGNNSNGQLGDGTQDSTSIPVQVQDIDDAVSVSAGYTHSLVLRQDGVAWAWGSGASGQFGDGLQLWLQDPQKVAGISDAKYIAIGRSHQVAVKEDGTVWAWGRNDFGQLGNGTTDYQLGPTKVEGLNDVKYVFAGDAFTIALKEDGTVWSWGANYGYQLGDGTNNYRHTPAQVQGIDDVKWIAVCNGGVLALKNDGTLWCWGDDNGFSLAPGNLGTIRQIVEYSGVRNMHFIADDRSGDNGLVILFDNGDVITKHYYNSGIQQSDLAKNNAAIVSGGGGYILFDEDKTAYSCSIGNLDNASRIFADHELEKIAMGDGYVLFVDSNKRLWQSGWISKPLSEIEHLPNVVDVAALEVFHGLFKNPIIYFRELQRFIFLTEDGDVWQAGNGYYGELGITGTSQSNTPVRVGVKNYYPVATPVQLPEEKLVINSNIAENQRLYLLPQSQTVNLYDEFNYVDFRTGEAVATQKLLPMYYEYNILAGDSEAVEIIENETGLHVTTIGYIDQENPVIIEYKVAGETDETAAVVRIVSQYDEGNAAPTIENLRIEAVGGNAKAVTALYDYSDKENDPEGKTEFAWKVYNEDTQAYDEIPGETKRNFNIPKGFEDKAIVVEVVVKQLDGHTSGYKYVSGTYTVNQLHTNIVSVHAGNNHSVILKGDGTVWTSGGNEFGQLGDGTNISKTAPVQVDITGVIAVAAGGEHCVALKADGTVWTWGQNWVGQLGDATNTNRNKPVQVAGLSNIKNIAVGDNYCLALKTDGTVYSWGENNYGQLGDGTTENRNSPVQVDEVVNVASVQAQRGNGFATSENGTTWGWGRNDFGQLGDGTTKNRVTPLTMHGVGDVEPVVMSPFYSIRKNGFAISPGNLIAGSYEVYEDISQAPSTAVRRYFENEYIGTVQIDFLATVSSNTANTFFSLGKAAFTASNVYSAHRQATVRFQSAGYIFSYTGSNAGTDYTYEAEKTYHVRIVCDIQNATTGTQTIYMDDGTGLVQIYSGKMNATNSLTGIGSFEIETEAGSVLIERLTVQAG